MINIENYKIPQRIAKKFSDACQELSDDVDKETGAGQFIAINLVANYLVSLAQNIVKQLEQVNNDKHLH